MSLDAKIVGGVSGAAADVDVNRNVLVNLPRTLPAGTLVGGGTDMAGFVALLGEADDGEVMGFREAREVEVTADYRVRVANDTTMFNEIFPGSALNSSLWKAPVTTAAVAVAGNFLTLNSASSLASGAVAQVSTYRHFPCYTTFPLYVTTQVQFSAVPAANCVHEWGAILATGVAAPTDGAFFRINATSLFQAVLNVGGVETVSTIADFSSLIGVNTTHQFLITIGSGVVDYWIDNVKVASIVRPPAAGSTTASAMLPVTFRSYNTALVTGTACLLKVGAINVSMGEMTSNKAWSHVIVGAGGSGLQGQTGGTLGTTALYTNSLAAGAGAAATNTTAALGSGLGGQFSLLPTLAAGTDGIICSYQVPLGTSAVPGKSLYVTGVNIEAAITTTLTGGPVVGAFSMAFGHTSVSLATTTGATTKAPVRMPIGFQSFAAAAAVGTLGQPLIRDFDRAPVCIQPGEFVQIVMKNLGTVTTAGVITFLISFDAYWE